MRNTIILTIVSLVFFGCKKETYSSTPTLTYKSVNTTKLYPDQIIEFNLNFTDSEGDVIDTLYVQKVSLNCAASNFSDRSPIPRFPTTKNLSGEILVSYSNGINNPGYITIASRCDYNDTCYFRFMLKDQAGNKSDTVSSDIIVVCAKINCE
jgi:hypothetical protein